MNTLKTFLIVAACWSIAAHAGEGLDRLHKFSKELKTTQADFTQTVMDERMKQLESSRGHFVLKKPGQFRWDYVAPYKQSIIADGKKLWIYDPELEQVTVKPIDKALGTAPIALLTGHGDLDKEFKITELGGKGDQKFVQLELKVKDTDYGKMLLALSKKGLEVMELKDKLGQVTHIEFHNVKINQPVDSKLFKFTVPHGVDVIGSR